MMTPPYNSTSRRKTKVTVLATYNLVRNYLRLLLEGERNLSISDIVGTRSELLEKVSASKPDVIVMCLMKDEGKDIEAITELFQAAPQTKIVILTSPDSLLDQPAALKLGVMGIVSTNQNARVLTRAIEQVSEGEVWLNQKLLAQLVENKFTPDRSKNATSKTYQEELTARELDVVKMIGMGMKNKDISKNLYISEATVRCHLSSIYSKVCVDDRLNLAIYAYRQRLVQPAASSL